MRMRPVNRRGDVLSKERIISLAGVSASLRNCRKYGKQIERCVIPRSPRAWGSRASFANGRTRSGLAIDHGSNACLPRLIHTFTDFRDRCGCPTGARAYKLRILRKRVLCRRENATSFPSFRTKTRLPSLLSRGCSTWPRLTIELLLARKKIELSSLRSRLTRERRMRMVPLAKCTSVEFRHASRREMSLICTTRALESSVRKAKSPRRILAGSPSPKQE
jgi:hypothetical protein